MSGSIVERLRRVKHLRTQWVEPHGEVDLPVDADMADWEGVFAVPRNPDGPEAADTIECLLEALEALVDDVMNNDANDAFLIAKHAGIAAIRQAKGETA